MKEKLYLGTIIFVSLFLNIYGINWGLPNENRKNIFPDKGLIKEWSGLLKEEREEIYQKTGGNPIFYGYWLKKRHLLKKEEEIIRIPPYKKGEVPTKEQLHIVRPYLLRSHHPDEQVTLSAIAGMKPGKLDFNPHFFQYGGFYIYSVAIALKLASMMGFITLKSDIGYYFLNPSEMGKFFIVGRFLGIISVVFSIILLYFIGKELFSKRIGLLASLFFAIVPCNVIYPHELKPHTFGIVWALASFYASIMVLKNKGKKWYFFGGVSAGLSAGTSLFYGSTFISIFLAHIINKKGDFRLLVLAILGGLLGFFGTNPYWLVCPKEVLGTIGHSRDWYPSYLTIYTFFSYYTVALKYGVRTPLLVLIGAGVIYSLFKHKKEDFLVLGLVLPYLFYISFEVAGGLSYGEIRYALHIVPLLLLLAARFIDALVCVFYKKPIFIAIFLIVGYTFLYSFSSSLNFAKDATNENTRNKSAKWISSSLKKGESIGAAYLPQPSCFPPFDFLNYELIIIDEHAFQKPMEELPNYFILSGIVPSSYYKNILKRYNEIKRFDPILSFFGIPFSDQFTFANHTVQIFKKK
ncbi:MAG: glycosyltransferase family 39 protein [bacterium]